MKKELKDIIESDFIRYGKEYKVLKQCFLPMEMKWLVTWRKASFYPKKSIKGILYRIAVRGLSQKTLIQIPVNTKIGRGFYIGHCGRIIINPEAKLGNNVNIATGVTIGQTNRGAKKGVPTIGNEVWIGTNAVIVGKIEIGDDVLIAPNAYVNFDVPSHSVVVGNPAKIHSADNACKDYINRVV